MSEWAQEKGFRSITASILKQECRQAFVRSQSAQHHCLNPGCFPQRDPGAGPRALSSGPAASAQLLVSGCWSCGFSLEGSSGALLSRAPVLHSSSWRVTAHHGDTCCLSITHRWTLGPCPLSECREQCCSAHLCAGFCVCFHFSGADTWEWNCWVGGASL